MEPNYGLDHAMVLVNDVPSATKDFAALGFSVTEGGEMGNGWLHNAGIVFPDQTYLEVLGFKRRWVLPALRILKRAGVLSLIFSRRSGIERRFLMKAAAGNGLVDFALLSKTIEDDVQIARGRGLAIEGPLSFSLEQPDGQKLSWLQASPQALDLPFLVEYVTPRSIREGHPNGAEGVASITVAVKNLDASVHRYNALLGVEPTEGADPSLAGERTVDFALGSATITLAEPADGGPLRSHLTERGEGPYAVRLRTKEGANVGALDPTRTHGTRLELVAA